MQDDGIAGLICGFQGAAHGWFFVQVEYDFQVIFTELFQSRRFGSFGFRQVQYLLHQAVFTGQVLVDALHSFAATHGTDLFHGLSTECITDKGQLWVEYRVHLAGGILMFNPYIGYWQHAAGEILSGSDSALHGIGIKTNFAFFGLIVLRDQLFLFQALAEILAHHGLKFTTALREFTRS